MAKGTSGYLKPKKQTYKELDEAIGDKAPAPKTENPIDMVEDQLERDNEESHGITNRIRNIFAD